MTEINITCSIEFFSYLLYMLNIKQTDNLEGVLLITSGSDSDIVYSKFDKNTLLNVLGVKNNNISVINIYSNAYNGGGFSTFRNARNSKDLYSMLYKPNILVVDYRTRVIPKDLNLPDDVFVAEYNIAKSGISEVFINGKTHLVPTKNKCYNVYDYISKEIGKHLDGINYTNYENIMVKLDDLKSSIKSLEDSLI